MLNDADTQHQIIRTWPPWDPTKTFKLSQRCTDYTHNTYIAQFCTDTQCNLNWYLRVTARATETFKRETPQVCICQQFAKLLCMCVSPIPNTCCWIAQYPTPKQLWTWHCVYDCSDMSEVFARNTHGTLDVWSSQCPNTSGMSVIYPRTCPGTPDMSGCLPTNYRNTCLTVPHMLLTHSTDWVIIHIWQCALSSNKPGMQVSVQIRRVALNMDCALLCVPSLFVLYVCNWGNAPRKQINIVHDQVTCGFKDSPWQPAVKQIKLTFDCNKFTVLIIAAQVSIRDTLMVWNARTICLLKLCNMFRALCKHHGNLWG